MNQGMWLELDDWLNALQTRQIRLPWEIGTFIALHVCESLQEKPASIHPKEVSISDFGAIVVDSSSTSVDTKEVTQSVVSLLASLLVAAGSEVPDSLLQLAMHGPADGSWKLERLRDELEASLIPLNRPATSRVLARLIRESQRPAPPSVKPQPLLRPSNRPVARFAKTTEVSNLGSNRATSGEAESVSGESSQSSRRGLRSYNSTSSATRPGRSLVWTSVSMTLLVVILSFWALTLGNPAVPAKAEIKIQISPKDARVLLFLGQGATPSARSKPSIVTQPPGAAVYQFLGVGPNVVASGLDPNATHQVVVTRTGYVTQRIQVTPSQFKLADGHKTATLRVTLRPAK